MKHLILVFMCSILSVTSMKAHPFVTDTIQTRNGGLLEITFIKHASLLLSYEGHSIEIDPVSSYADYSTFPKADVILITHEHHDHLDPKAIEALEKKETILIANQNSRNILDKGIVMKNGDKLSPTDYLSIEAVPAYNTTIGRDIYHPKNRDNGYILTIGGTRIYISGDTEDIPEMKNLKSIDIAFLSVNQPYTMTINQAVHATEMIIPAILYPYHYSDTPIEQLKEKLKNQPVDVRIRELQ